MHDTLLTDWIDIRQAEFADEEDTEQVTPLTEPYAVVTIPQWRYLELLALERVVKGEVE